MCGELLVLPRQVAVNELESLHINGIAALSSCNPPAFIPYFFTCFLFVYIYMLEVWNSGQGGSCAFGGRAPCELCSSGMAAKNV